MPSFDTCIASTSNRSQSSSQRAASDGDRPAGSSTLRPALRHANVTSSLGAELRSPFVTGRGGPGGWVILFEPELHLGRDILVPDLAGWRRERVAEGMLDEAFATTPPSWVCEVLSPSTMRLDRGRKRVSYAREGVEFVWLIDPEARSLEVLRLDGPTYRILETAFDDAKVRAEPFESFELDLSLLWTL